MLENLAPPGSAKSTPPGSNERDGSLASASETFPPPRKSSFDSVDCCSQMSRPAVIAPPDGSKHKDYNRLKYYSKLRTSFLSGSGSQSKSKEVSDYSNDIDFLRPPVHVIDPQLFILHIPFTKQSK